MTDSTPNLRSICAGHQQEAFFPSRRTHKTLAHADARAVPGTPRFIGPKVEIGKKAVGKRRNTCFYREHRYLWDSWVVSELVLARSSIGSQDKNLHFRPSINTNLNYESRFTPP
jgi:hypothetical protein